jgi:polar amino acid transport system substrate-binding protein
MRKFLALTLAALMMLALMTGCNQAQQAPENGDQAAADESLTRIKTNGKLILGFDEGFPPMGFVDESGKHVGFDLDVAGEVAKRLGVELVLQPIVWGSNISELDSYNVDCLWNGMTITDERKEKILFSDPYLENEQVLVVMNDSGFNTLDDLKGKKLGIQAGSSAEIALDSKPEFKAALGDVVSFKDNLEAFMDLEAGGIDVVLVDSIVAGYNISVSGKPYRMLEEPLANELFGIGFRKSDVALCDAVNETLKEMASDGTLARISTEWFSKDITIIGK